MARQKKTKEDEALVNTPAKALALEETGTIVGTLSKVYSQALLRRCLREY